MSSNFGTRRDRPSHLTGVPSSFDRTPENRDHQEEKEYTVADLTREELNARLESADLRVAGVVDAMRADNNRLSNQIEKAVDAMKFSADSAKFELAAGQAELRADLKSGMANVATDIEKLKGDFHQSIATQTKWIAVMVFGAVAAFAAIFGMFKPAVPASAPPAPYVIYAQPPAAAAAVTPAAQQPQQAPSPNSIKH